MNRVLITGSSGAIGRCVVDLLCASPDLEFVAGIDVREPDSAPESFSFTRADVRAPLAELLTEKRIDTVVHCAFAMRPIHDTRLMEDVNVGGAVNLLAACAASGVRHFVQLSSATVYGFQPTSRAYTERDPTQTSPNFLYPLHKARVEKLLEEFGARHPEIAISVLRPSLVAGRGNCDPVMRYLQNRFVLIPDGDVRLQVTHVEDLAAIIRLLIRDRRTGIFNIGAAGSVALADAIRGFGNTPIRIPYSVLKPLNEAAWRCRLTKLAPAPGAALRILRHSWLVDSTKLIGQTGFSFRYSSVEALREFANGR